MVGSRPGAFIFLQDKNLETQISYHFVEPLNWDLILWSGFWGLSPDRKWSEVVGSGRKWSGVVGSGRKSSEV